MNTRHWVFTVLILFVIILTASRSSNDHILFTEDVVERDSVVRGQELFRMNCASCHGNDRKGNQPMFPSLLNVNDKLTKNETTALIKSGKGKMPPMTHLSEEEIDAIAAHLFGETNNKHILINNSLSPIQQGERLFMSNCAGCHRAKRNAAKPQNTTVKMCSMKEAPELAGVTKRYTENEFQDILEKEAGNMPSFNDMKQNEKEALYDYLETLEVDDKPRPKRKIRRRGCGMM